MYERVDGLVGNKYEVSTQVCYDQATDRQTGKQESESKAGRQ